MKITFVSPFASLAGGTRVMAAYAHHLHRAGHEVTVVSQPQQQPKAGLKPALKAFIKGKKRRVRGHPTPLLQFLGDKHIVLDQPRPVTAEDVPDADAVIATWWETAEWVAELPQEKGRKFYFIQDYEMLDHLPLDRVAATFKLPLRKLAVSQYIADMLALHHAVEGVRILPNAVDTGHFDAPPRGKNSYLTVGFVYTTIPRKNVGLAIEAVQAAKARLPDLRVLAFGGRPAGDTPGLPDWVTYHPKPAQEAIPELYAACDLWLFTSAHEGFGLPLLEAMACRTPVLATTAGAAPELVDGQTGVLLASDAATFAEEIMRFHSMEDAQWQRYAQAAHHRAHRYGWPEAARLMLRYLSA